MAIMKLSNVPELTEFAGTEKIYVNDNGETKQIDTNKFIPKKEEKVIWNYDSGEYLDRESVVKALEDGRSIWMLRDGQLHQFLSYALYNFCGPQKTLIGSYLAINESGSQGNGATIKTVMIGGYGWNPTESDFIARLEALGL